MYSIVNIVGFFFVFDEPGGPDHLLPGRPLEQTTTIVRPSGAGFMVSLASFNGYFYTDGGAHLTERPLGQFLVSAGFRDPNTLVCRVRLTDSNSDDPIHIEVSGTVLFYA
jgi:hypothetical protein